MPTFATQVSVDLQERRRANTTFAGVPNAQPLVLTSAAVAPRIPPGPGKKDVRIIGPAKYGSIPQSKKKAADEPETKQIPQTILEGEQESEEDEDERFASQS